MAPEFDVDTPMSKLKGAVSGFLWIYLGMRYAFVSPKELAHLRASRTAPRQGQLFLGAVTAFILLAELLEPFGFYNGLVDPAQVAVEAQVVECDECSPAQQPPESGTAAEQPAPPTGDQTAATANNSANNDNMSGLVGVPAKLWSWTGDFFRAALVLSALPSFFVFLFAGGTVFLARALGRGNRAGLMETADYIFFQAFNLSIITLLMAGAGTLAWQVVVSALSLAPDGLMGWVLAKLPLGTFFAQLPGAFYAATQEFGPGGSTIYLGAAIAMICVCLGAVTFCYHSFDQSWWRALLVLGSPIALYLAVPSFPLTFFRHTSWIWSVVFVSVAGLYGLAFLPILLCLLALIGLKRLILRFLPDAGTDNSADPRGPAC